jgi:hypothetical protein
MVELVERAARARTMERVVFMMLIGWMLLAGWRTREILLIDGPVLENYETQMGNLVCVDQILAPLLWSLFRFIVWKRPFSHV